MITAIRAASAILAGDIALAARHSPAPLWPIAYTVAATIAALVWGLGHLYRRPIPNGEP